MGFPMKTNCLQRFVILAALLGLSSQSGLPAEAPTEPENLTLAEKGYWLLLNKPLGSVTLTESDYDDLWKVWPEPLKTRAANATPAERRALALERYGFQNSPDRPAGAIPQQFTSDGKGGMAFNCLACHGGKVAGKVILGLGNSHYNQETFLDDLVQLLAQSGRTPPAFPKNVPRDAAPPVRGLNNAFGASIAFLIVRDRDMELTLDKLQFPAPPEEGMDMPTDTPAYWLVHRKRYLYYDGFIEKTHRTIMQFSFEFDISGKTARGWEDDFAAIFAWINSLRSPKYPWKIDDSLAQRGRQVFNSECAPCHGTYGEGGLYPERLVSLKYAGTDPVRSMMSVEFKKHLAQSWLGDYGKAKLRTEQKAYVAPPLDGVWATAPYLHNGSVPTLWHLLNPSKRPAVWLRTEDGYDQKKVGLEVEEFHELPGSVKDPQERRLYYNTKLWGLGDEGHRFPAKDLSEGDQRALLEYLKSL
jgi:mono/diheme cytochrome c family protein